MKQLILFSGSFFIFMFFFASCKPTDSSKDEQVTDQIFNGMVTGPTTEVANSSVGLSGAIINISKPQSPVDGMEISIPANSFSTVQTVKVSYAEIKSHKFGPNFNPISPMITIGCDGGYSNDIMSVTIPVKIPAGHIPLGFYLDETTGKLEGIPVNTYTANSITLLTRHFLPSSKLKSGNINLKSAISAGANIVISSIAESVLDLPPIITSGFKPGVDDWEFVNFGSYIATSGHCAGQNMTAMWYYFEKKASDGSLFNKYSDNANLWEDNAKGYRFCSVVQQDQSWSGDVQSFFEKYIDKNQEFDKQKLLTIAGTMLITGEPQAVAIYRANGKFNTNGTPKYNGHALICYQISVSEGKMYISDPNTPGTGQTINFANNKFSPYLAKLNGNDAAESYPFISYYAKTAVIEWDKIGKRWGELVNNTIGTIAPNIFPAYTIWVKDKINDFELKNEMTVTTDTLRTYVECPTAGIFVHVNGKDIISSQVYDTKGAIISEQNVNKPPDWSLSPGLYTKLTPGLNKLGYSIIGWNSKALFNNSTKNKPLFIDFKWINVYYTKLEISPNPIIGEPDKEIVITARTFKSAPKNAKYVWNFGDGTSEVTVTNDSIVKYKFKKSGDFNVVLKLYDNLTNELKGTSAAKATIGKNFVKFSFYFSVSCNSKTTDLNGNTTTGTNWEQISLFQIPCVQKGNIITANWNGVYQEQHKGSATFTLESDHTVSFTVSDLGTFSDYIQTTSATGKGALLTDDNPSFWQGYSAPESFSVLKTASFKKVFNTNWSIENTGFYFDPIYAGQHALKITFYN